MNEREIVDPEVTVIVPAFNAAEWIAQTLQSIQAQTYTRWEVLVADDASIDDTGRIVDQLALCDPRIRRLRLPANSGGPAGPRNFALSHARAPWVAFCDADDLWHPQKLQLQLDVAQAESADLVCTAIRDFTPPSLPGPDEPVGSEQGLHAQGIGLWRLLGKNIIPSVLCKRALITEAGGFDTARYLVAVEDYDLWLRLLERGAKVVKLQMPLVNYRRLPGSLSARKTRLARRVLHVLQRHFTRRGRPWMYPIAAPLLMASYGLQAVYFRLWRGRL